MKIAVLPSSYLPTVGGRQVFAYNISRRLASAGHDVQVHVPVKSYNRLQPQFRELCVPLPRYFYGLIVRLPHLGLFRVRRYLRRKQRQENYDAWLVVATYPSGYAAGCLKGTVPIVLRASGDDIQKSPGLDYGLRLDRSNEAAIQWTVRSFDKVVAMTEAARGDFRDLGVSDESIVSIPNGVDLEAFTRDRDVADIRSDLGWPNDREVILTTGRNHPKKGFGLIPSIAEKLRKRGFSFRWYVVGQGTNTLDQEIRSRRLGEYVVTVDQVDPGTNVDGQPQFPDKGLVMMYQAADIYAFPTLLENFAMVLLEAMAAGAAFVSTDAPGCGELVNHGENGLLARAGDVDDFALQLERVLNEPKLRTALAQNAREFVQAYSWKNVARQYEELFNELRSTPKEVSQSGRDQKKP